MKGAPLRAFAAGAVVAGLASCAAVPASQVAIVAASEIAKLVTVKDGAVALNAEAVQAEIERFTALSPARQCEIYFGLKYVVAQYAPAGGQKYLAQAAAAIEGQNFSCGVAAGGAPAPAPVEAPLAQQTADIAVAPSKPIEVGD